MKVIDKASLIWYSLAVREETQMSDGTEKNGNMFVVVATNGFTIPSSHTDARSPMGYPRTVKAGDKFAHNNRETAQRHADKNNEMFAKYGGDCWEVMVEVI